MPYVSNEEYEDMMQASDVGVLSLKSGVEGTCVPSKYYSLLHSGKPILAVMEPNAEAALSIQEEQCGLVVRPGEPENLLTQIQRLAAEPALAKGMGERAKAAHAEKYTGSKIAEEFNRVLRSVLN
jgi:glycosyltransferase involved in cell wall biosynthesis